MRRSLKDIEVDVDRVRARFDKVMSHPHRQTLKYYPHRMGLVHLLRYEDFKWLNENTTAPYSVDNTCGPFNISFEKAEDRLMVKLKHPGGLFCKAHD